MPATAADIGAGTRPVLTVTWQDADIAARYPNARDATLTPAQGYFDSEADAQAAVDARGAIVGVERDGYAVPVHDLIWPDLSAGIPTARLIDAELAADKAALTARLELDLEAETTSFELFG